MKLPAQIGKYEILDLIGRGGMGVVYKARDTVLGRLVALKVMTSSLADNAEVRERFLREARAVSMLQHANIVVVFELGEHDGNPYIVMEYLDGEPLDCTIRANIALTVLQKIDIILQVSKALQYAHERGIVHRDVKPGNIMLMRDGNVKVVDFGIAHLADHTITRTGLVLGTVSYMSPEQLNGEPVDARTDIFSLGIVFYLLLTGKLPFEGASTAETMMKILLEPPPRLAQFGDVNPPELQPIIDRALAKQREERYQTCAEMAEGLVRVRNRIGMQMQFARPDEEVELLAQFGRQSTIAPDSAARPTQTAAAAHLSKRLVWTGSLLLLAVASFIGILVYNGSRHRSIAPSGRPQSSSAAPTAASSPSVSPPAASSGESSPKPGSTTTTTSSSGEPLAGPKSTPTSSSTAFSSKAVPASPSRLNGSPYTTASSAGEGSSKPTPITIPEHAQESRPMASSSTVPSPSFGNERFQVKCDCGGYRYHNGVMTISNGVIRYDLSEAADRQLSFVVFAAQIKNVRLPSGEKRAKFGIELTNGLYYRLTVFDDHDKMTSADGVIKAIQRAIPELRH
jgi:serine/threonine protein kinase